MAHSNGIIDPSSTVNLLADVRAVLGIASGDLTVLHRSSVVRQWNICKPVKDTRVSGTDIVNGNHTATSFDGNSHTIPDSAGELSTGNASFNGVSGYFWNCYGMKIPVIASASANDIYTATLALADSSKNWAADRPTYPYPARLRDFRGYNHNITKPSFTYTISDAYSNRDAVARFGLNDGESTAYRFGMKNVWALFNQWYMSGNWKPAVAYTTPGGNCQLAVYNGADQYTEEYVEIALPGLSSSADATCHGAFCLVNQTLGRTILMPSLSADPNPVSFVVHGAGAPTNWNCYAWDEGLLGYTASGEYMRIAAMESPQMYMVTSGKARVRITVWNYSASAQYFTYSSIQPHIDGSAWSYYGIYYEGSTTPIPAGTQAYVASMGSVTFDIELNNLISSGYLTRYLDIYHGGSDITTGTAELYLYYGTSGQGTFIQG